MKKKVTARILAFLMMCVFMFGNWPDTIQAAHLGEWSDSVDFYRLDWVGLHEKNDSNYELWDHNSLTVLLDDGYVSTTFTLLLRGFSGKGDVKIAHLLDRHGGDRGIYIQEEGDDGDDTDKEPPEEEPKPLQLFYEITTRDVLQIDPPRANDSSMEFVISLIPIVKYVPAYVKIDQARKENGLSGATDAFLWESYNELISTSIEGEITKEIPATNIGEFLGGMIAALMNTQFEPDPIELTVWCYNPNDFEVTNYSFVIDLGEDYHFADAEAGPVIKDPSVSARAESNKTTYTIVPEILSDESEIGFSSWQTGNQIEEHWVVISRRDEIKIGGTYAHTGADGVTHVISDPLSFR